MIKSYQELIKIPSFKERFMYLQLRGTIGEDIFGYDRYLNQEFYSSSAWRRFRREILIRDEGCDLGIEDCPINGVVIVHHINPIRPEDIENNSPGLLDQDNVICVSEMTHRAIHYGDWSLIPKLPKDRTPNDMCPWRM